MHKNKDFRWEDESLFLSYFKGVLPKKATISNRDNSSRFHFLLLKGVVSVCANKQPEIYSL
jgi:hypothetical protein